MANTLNSGTPPPALSNDVDTCVVEPPTASPPSSPVNLQGVSSENSMSSGDFTVVVSTRRIRKAKKRNICPNMVQTTNSFRSLRISETNEIPEAINTALNYESTTHSDATHTDPSVNVPSDLSQVGSVLKRKKSVCLTKFFPFTDLDSDFVFELRRKPDPIVTVKGNKQILRLTLFDRDGEDFEVNIWAPKAQEVYELLSNVQPPVCLDISHGRLTTPKPSYVPRTSIKTFQMSIPTYSQVSISNVPPTKKATATRFSCSCKGICDHSCRPLPSPSGSWDFSSLAAYITQHKKPAKFYKSIRVALWGTPATRGREIHGKVTDGRHFAFIEFPKPAFEVKEETELHLDVFSVTIKNFGNDRKALLINPHCNHPPTFSTVPSIVYAQSEEQLKFLEIK